MALKLTRRVNESVRIGADLIATVRWINRCDVGISFGKAHASGVPPWVSIKIGESLALGADDRIEVVAVHGRQVVLGFHCPAALKIWREEVYQCIQRGEPRRSNGSNDDDRGNR